MTSASKASLPASFALLFEARLAVQRAEYAARIEMTGQAVSMYERDDDVYAVHSVNPGGVVGFGASIEEACRDHTQRLGLVLDDLLQESASYDEFERRAQALFAYESPWSRQQFDRALEEAVAPQFSSGETSVAEPDYSMPPLWRSVGPDQPLPVPVTSLIHRNA